MWVTEQKEREEEEEKARKLRPGEAFALNTKNNDCQDSKLVALRIRFICTLYVLLRSKDISHLK